MSKRNKKIGLLSSSAFAVGAMIGGGVFVLSGLAIHKAGPASIVSFLLAGVMVMFSAMSFAVIASMSSGEYSGYSMVGNLLGSKIWSFLTSWSFYLAGIIGAAFVLNAFGAYIHQFIISTKPAVMWALIGALLMTLINLGPASSIAKVENLLVGVKLCILIMLIVFGLAAISPHDFHPFVVHGSSSILITSAYLFIAFLGFNVITNISSEIDNPKKTIPKAIILSMSLVTVVYVGVVIALLAANLSSYSEASVGLAANKLIGPIGGGLIVAGALISTLSSANANILGSSEIMVRMALDKQVPTVFGKMKRGHPYYSVIAGGVLYVVLILSGSAEAIVGLANVTAIAALILVNLAAFNALRKKDYSGIKLPLGKVIPVLGAIGAGIQFLFMPASYVGIGFALILAGLIAYAFRIYGHRPRAHEHLRQLFEESSGPLVRALKR